MLAVVRFIPKTKKIILIVARRENGPSIFTSLANDFLFFQIKGEIIIAAIKKRINAKDNGGI